MPGRALFTLFLRSANGTRNLSGTVGNSLVHVRHRFKGNGKKFGAEFAFDPLQDERHVDPVSDYVRVESESTRQFNILFVKGRHCGLSPLGVTEPNKDSNSIIYGNIKARELHEIYRRRPGGTGRVGSRVSPVLLRS
jgi:hypothetical protein